MATIDVFRADAFRMRALSGYFSKMPYIPQYLGGLGVFPAEPIRTHDFFVDRENDSIGLIPTSPLGAPVSTQVKDRRDAIPLTTVRLAEGDRLTARDIDGVRASGSETEVQAMQTEIAKRGEKLEKKMLLTEEYHRLGAIQGLLLDADGTSVLHDYYADFGFARPAPVNFNLGVATTNVRQVERNIIRDISRRSRGAITPATTFHVLCGDNFYDNLVEHDSVSKFYVNHSAAVQYRGSGSAFESFQPFAFVYHNYRGTDDNTTVAIPPNECRIFPVNGNEVFGHAMAPAEDFGSVNQLGQRRYSKIIPDKDENMYVDLKMYSYPLFYCKRPSALQSGVAS